MGEDYAARKSAKKKRKRLAMDGAGEAAPEKKDRKRRRKIRRLCRGMCYKEPQISKEDMEWKKENSDDESVPLAPIPTTHPLLAEPVDPKAKKPKKPKKLAAPKQKLKLSTKVDLVDTAELQHNTELEAQQGNRHKKSNSKSQKDAKSAEVKLVNPAFLNYPEAIQKFMAGEAFEQATAIQERY